MQNNVVQRLDAKFSFAETNVLEFLWQVYDLYLISTIYEGSGVIEYVRKYKHFYLNKLLY